VAQLDVWSWLYGPPTKNVAHPCSKCLLSSILGADMLIFFINILRNFTCVTDLLVFNPLGHCISFCSSFTPHIHRVTLFIVFYCWHSFSFNGFVSLNASYFTLSSSWLFLSVIWRDEGPMFNQLKRRRRFNIVERTFILFQQHI